MTKLLSCVHTHSTFCDGLDSPAEMARAAYEMGFVSLGFSGHGYAPYDPYCMSEAREAAYRAEIRRLRGEYEGKMEILLGQEHEALSPYADFSYDYLLESVHFIPAQEGLRCVDWGKDVAEEIIRDCFGGDPYAYCRQYFETCAAAYEKSPAQIAGHLDLVTKFNEGGAMFDEADPRYLNPAMEALEAAVRRGLVVEINTGAVAKGYRTAPYPCKTLLRRLRELGGRVMVNSDCHNKNHLSCWYREAETLLKECGFESAVILRRSGFEEVGI